MHVVRGASSKLADSLLVDVSSFGQSSDLESPLQIEHTDGF